MIERCPPTGRMDLIQKCGSIKKQSGTLIETQQEVVPK